MSLMLHCGSHYVSADDLRNRVDETPSETETWKPISHHGFLEQVKAGLDRKNFTVTEEAHGLTTQGAQYFGLMALQGEGLNEHDQEYEIVLGLRNSHDKKFSANVGLGSKVFVCDNLSFIADFQIGRRHTSKLFADLPGRIDSVIGQAIACRQIQDQRIDFLKSTNFDTLLGDQTDRYVHDIAIKALDEKIVTGSSIPRVLNQWRKPRHNEFQPRTGWSLFNSFTEVTKRQHAGNSMVTTRKLHTLLYDFCQSISA